jgi:hypothetical protein
MSVSSKMKGYQLPERVLAKERFSPVFDCKMGSLFGLANDSNFYFSCTVTQQASGQTGKDNTMQYFPPNGGLPWPCLSALLTVGGVIEPSATVVGYIEVFYGGPIWMGWGNNEEIDIEPEDQTCLGNTIWGKASDGNVYVITIAAHWFPHFPIPFPH